jgi:hypothetical protein
MVEQTGPIIHRLREQKDHLFDNCYPLVFLQKNN